MSVWSYPEPVISWLDVCGADVSGVSGEGPLRAVRTTIHLDGEVASGPGAAYWASFKTEHCGVSHAYRIYPGPQESETAAWGTCDYRSEPCEWPVSELPNVSCGSYDGEFDLRDTDAISVAVEGSSVTITFDPNKLPEGSAPAGLVHDLSPEGAPPDTHFRPLVSAWVHSLPHQGVRGVMSNTIGPGGDSAWRTQPVPLD